MKKMNTFNYNERKKTNREELKQEKKGRDNDRQSRVNKQTNKLINEEHIFIVYEFMCNMRQETPQKILFSIYSSVEMKAKIGPEGAASGVNERNP